LPTSTKFTGRARESKGHLNGTYAITIPALDTKRLDLQVDGDLTYAAAGDRLMLSLPSGTKVGLGHGRIEGKAKVGVNIQGGASAITLEDGRYTLAIDGPVTMERLILEKIKVRDLDFDGSIESQGTFASRPGEAFEVQGRVTSELTVVEGEDQAEGAVDVILNEFQAGGTVRSGSTASLDLEQVTLRTDPIQPGLPTRFRSLEVEDGHVSANADVTSASYVGKGGATRAQLGGLQGEGDVTFSAKTGEGLGALNGTVDARVTSGGTVSLEGLPGAPVLPSKTPSAPTRAAFEAQPQPMAGARHTVVKGDSLWRLGQTYGVTPAEIKLANGLESDTIHVGQVLQIPGEETGAVVEDDPGADFAVDFEPETAVESQPAPRTGHVTQEVRAGSTVRLEIDSARQGSEGLEVDGHVTTQLQLGQADVNVGSVEAKILGQAQLSLARSGFSWRGGQPNSLRMGRVKVPVRLQIDKGSRCQVKLPTAPVDIVMDRDGSYAEFIAHVVLTEDGARLAELSDAELFLESAGTGLVAGKYADIPGEKMIHFKGRMVILERGLDFFGEITVRVRGGDDEPIVKIRW
jgi:LysM repeat protein